MPTGNKRGDAATVTRIQGLCAGEILRVAQNDTIQKNRYRTDTNTEREHE